MFTTWVDYTSFDTIRSAIRQDLSANFNNPGVTLISVSNSEDHAILTIPTIIRLDPQLPIPGYRVRRAFGSQSNFPLRLSPAHEGDRGEVAGGRHERKAGAARAAHTDDEADDGRHMHGVRAQAGSRSDGGEHGSRSDSRRGEDCEGRGRGSGRRREGHDGGRQTRGRGRDGHEGRGERDEGDGAHAQVEARGAALDADHDAEQHGGDQAHGQKGFRARVVQRVRDGGRRGRLARGGVVRAVDVLVDGGCGGDGEDDGARGGGGDVGGGVHQRDGRRRWRRGERGRRRRRGRLRRDQEEGQGRHGRDGKVARQGAGRVPRGGGAWGVERGRAERAQRDERKEGEHGGGTEMAEGVAGR